MSGTRLTTAEADHLAATAVRRGATASLRPQLHDVTIAILGGRPPARVEKLARRVAASLWARGLAELAEETLDALELEAARGLELAARARRELVRAPDDNRFAEHLVLCEALRAARETEVIGAALDAAEVSLRDEPPEARPRAALRHAGRIFALRGDVPRDELLDAAAWVAEKLDSFPDEDLAAPAARELARAVATEERRRAVRRASHVLRPAASCCPLFARELEQLVAVPPADDPGADELWVATVAGALELC